MDGTEQNNVNLGKNMRSSKFIERLDKHDKLKEEVMDIIRPYTSRRHMPDSRIAFNDIPCSWDLKVTTAVEKASHDEYFRLYKEENEWIFIVYKNGDGKDYGDGKLYADWIHKLKWSNLYSPSKNSTCNDYYYRISGGRLLDEFLYMAEVELSDKFKKQIYKQGFMKLS